MRTISDQSLPTPILKPFVDLMLDPGDRPATQAHRSGEPALVHPAVDRRPAQARAMQHFPQADEPSDGRPGGCLVTRLGNERHRQLLAIMHHVRLRQEVLKEERQQPFDQPSWCSSEEQGTASMRPLVWYGTASFQVPLLARNPVRPCGRRGSG